MEPDEDEWEDSDSRRSSWTDDTSSTCDDEFEIEAEWEEFDSRRSLGTSSTDSSFDDDFEISSSLESGDEDVEEEEDEL